MSATPMIELRQVVKTFKNAAGEFEVLKGINLTLYQGEFVAIVGKSGSGKSTLLNMMTGIDHPTGGQVVVNATDLYARMNESQRSLWRGRNMGIVFQFFQLLPMLTLLENVMLPMDYVGMYGFEERPRRAMDLLELVGLQAQADKLPVAVSTGQQQAAAIARALATNPPLLVADEPTGNLDSRSAQVIIDLFQALADQGKTIVMVTHDPSLTERTNRTIIISDGELIHEAVAKALPLLNHRQMLDVTQDSLKSGESKRAGPFCNVSKKWMSFTSSHPAWWKLSWRAKSVRVWSFPVWAPGNFSVKLNCCAAANPSPVCALRAMARSKC
jgi:putative ABC transport system ATP-binding protein